MTATSSKATAATAPKPTAEALAAEDQAATKVLLALHRLAQQSTLYAANNEAQHMALDAAASAAREYSDATGRNITVFFSERAIYVGRRLLRASRSTYGVAAHLRELLAKLGASQVTIGHDVSLEDLRALQSSFAAAQQGTGARAPEMTRIRLHVGRPPGEHAELDGLSPQERAIKVYALAIVIVRRFFEQLQRGHWEINTHVRRISEELIRLADGASPGLFAATVTRPAHDDAERAVSAALLALCMARRLTSDQRLLRWLATAALLCDVGKPRVAGFDPSGERRGGLRMPTLGLDQFAELPGATAYVTTALGRLTDAGMMRSVLVYETLHIEHKDETRTLYAGERGPAVLSRLIACARRFQHGLSAGHAGADVIADLARRADDTVDLWIVQLMMATLDLLPTGTLVELADGHSARVVSPPTDRIDFGRPLVRLVAHDGAPVASRYLDLSQPLADGSLPPRIVRILTEEHPPVEDAEATARAEMPTRPPARPRSTSSVRPMHQPDPSPGDDLRIMVGSTDDRARSPLPSVPPPPDPRPVSDRPISDLPPDSGPDAASDPDRASLVPHQRPKAHGTLGKTPLVHLLVYALDNLLGGTMLLLDGDRRRSAITFDQGVPCKAQTADLVSPLDRTLLKMGLLDEETLAHTLHAVATARRLHGQYLVRQGFLQPAELQAALEQQLIDKIGYMMRLPPDTRYAYFDGVDMLADYGGAAPCPIDPLQLVMMGVRKYVSYDTIDGILPRIANTPLALHPLADPERLGLKDDERRVVDLIQRSSLTLNQMLASGHVDADVGQRVMYALVITRCVDLSDQTRKPVGA